MSATLRIRQLPFAGGNHEEIRHESDLPLKSAVMLSFSDNSLVK
jgi:hypothetical protein